MKKTKAKKTTKRRTIKRNTSGQAAGIDLLRIADRTGLQRYAAEGLTNLQRRSWIALQHIEDGQGTYEKMTPEDYILLSQTIRERKGMEEDEIFAGIDLQVEEIAMKDAELDRLFQVSEAKHKEAGFGEDEEWPEDSRPPEIQKLFDAYWDRFHQLKVAILRHHGEDDMADLLLNDPDAYAEKAERGEKLTMKRASERDTGS
jgi:hypothetical protein